MTINWFCRSQRFTCEARTTFSSTNSCMKFAATSCCRLWYTMRVSTGILPILEEVLKQFFAQISSSRTTNGRRSNMMRKRRIRRALWSSNVHRWSAIAYNDWIRQCRDHRQGRLTLKLDPLSSSTATRSRRKRWRNRTPRPTRRRKSTRMPTTCAHSANALLSWRASWRSQ